MADPQTFHLCDVTRCTAALQVMGRDADSLHEAVQRIVRHLNPGLAAGPGAALPADSATRLRAEMIALEQLLQSHRQAVQDQARVVEGARDHWETLFGDAPDFIMAVDRDGTIRAINRVVPETTREEVIGSAVYRWTPPEQHPILRQAIEKVFATGDTSFLEGPGVGPGGSVRWYSSRVSPVRSQGRIVAAVLIATDVTEARRAAPRRRTASMRRPSSATRGRSSNWPRTVRRVWRSLSPGSPKSPPGPSRPTA